MLGHSRVRGDNKRLMESKAESKTPWDEAMARYRQLETDWESQKFPDLKSELQALIGRMSEVAQQTYWLHFWSGVPAHVHAFIEFNGLIAEWVKLCAAAAEQGIDFRYLNGHAETPLPMKAYQAEYFAEKLNCIIGPSLRADPGNVEAFKRALGI